MEIYLSFDIITLSKIVDSFRKTTPLTAYLNKIISHKYLLLALVATIVVSTAGLKNGWVNRDDDQYVLKNHLIQGDISEQAIDFLTQPVMGNYHPITMISLKIDQIMWGNHPSGYHATNIFFHLVSVVLAYIFFYLLTGRVFSAGLIALLFGVHPMHVESVAWISARKDVLYVAFLLASLVYWLLYAQDTTNKDSKKFSLISFGLSMLCKPMAVVLPLVLLLIDYRVKRPLSWHLLKEKWIFFVLSLLGGTLAIITQESSGALDATVVLSLLEKVTFAVYGLSEYLFKSILPIHLSAFHPYPNLENALPWYYQFSWVIAALVIGIMIRFRNNRSLVFGMGVFLISIAPVLQLLTFGDAITAERYTYFSYFGLFYLMAYGLEKARSNYSAGFNNIVRLLLLGVILRYGTIAYNRYGVWGNGETLWSDVIRKYPEDYLAYGTRANYHMSKGDFKTALVDYDKSIALNPTFVGTLTNRGLIRRHSGRTQAAMTDFNQVILLAPTSNAYLNRGLLFRDMEVFDKSLSDLSQAIALDESNAQAFLERGFLQTQMKAYKAAITDYTATLQLQPMNATAYFYRGDAYCLMNKLVLGIDDFSKAIQLNPNNGRTYFFRSRAYQALGNLMLAKEDALKADKLGFALPEGYLEGF